MSIHPIRTFQNFLGHAQHGDYSRGSAASRSPLIGKQVRMAQAGLDAALPPNSPLAFLAYMLAGGLPEGAFGKEAGLVRGVGRPVPRALGVIGHAPHRAEYDNLRRGQSVVGWENRLPNVGHSVKAPSNVVPLHPGFETGSSPFANWVNGGHPGVLAGGPQSAGLKAGAPRTGRAVMAHSIPEKNPPTEGYGLGRRPNLDRLAGAEMQRSVRGPGNITGRQIAGRTAVGGSATALGILGAALLGQQMEKGGARTRARRVQKERQHYGLH